MYGCLHVASFCLLLWLLKESVTDHNHSAELCALLLQGKIALVNHFQNSSLLHEDKRCRPILFHSNGPFAGDQEPFPMVPTVRSRVPRSGSTASTSAMSKDEEVKKGEGSGQE